MSNDGTSSHPFKDDFDVCKKAALAKQHELKVILPKELNNAQNTLHQSVIDLINGIVTDIITQQKTKDDIKKLASTEAKEFKKTNKICSVPFNTSISTKDHYMKRYLYLYCINTIHGINRGNLEAFLKNTTFFKQSKPRKGIRDAEPSGKFYKRKRADQPSRSSPDVTELVSTPDISTDSISNARSLSRELHDQGRIPKKRFAIKSKYKQLAQDENNDFASIIQSKLSCKEMINIKLATRDQLTVAKGIGIKKSKIVIINKKMQTTGKS